MGISKEAHKSIHRRLHKNLDKLLADFIVHTGKLPSKTNLMEFLTWSYNQTTNPTVKEE